MAHVQPDAIDRRRADVALEIGAWAVLAAVILLPRLYLWGTVPAGMHGDEGGFAATGAALFAAPAPLWSFGPQSLPNAHFWLYGAALHVLGHSVWSARLVTSLFGVLQAFAVVDIARRTAGYAAALTAAMVMAIPMELHFDRLAMCNVMTTATWVSALWCLVRFPHRIWSAAAAGMLLALGWYGYQSTRITPIIAAAALLPLLLRSDTRAPTLRLVAVGLVGFAVVIAPLAYGFYRQPAMLFGRAASTSWLAKPGGLWPALGAQLRATGWAMLGREVDQSGGFFPFDIPLIPIGLMLFAIVGLVACRSAPLRWCLAAWIGLVLVGNVMREQEFPVYSPVLVCLVPALALAAGYSVRWLRWAAPIGIGLAIVQPGYEYFHLAANVPPREIVPMAQAALLDDFRDAPVVFIAGGVGCGHGMTQFALRGRSCLEPPPAGAPAPPGAQLYIFYPPFFALEGALPGDSGLSRHVRQWDSTSVHIWSATPPPAASAALAGS